MRGVGAQNGDHVLEGTNRWDSWVRFAASPDTDSARLAFATMLKYSIAELVKGEEVAMIKPLEDIVQILDRCNLRPN